MRHPIETCNEEQAALLASLPEERREWMARTFRIGNATYCYYNRPNDLTIFGTNSEGNLSTEYLLDWLEQHINPQIDSRSARELLTIYFEEYVEGLPDDGLRRSEKEAGLDKVKNRYPFRRYVLERHDIGMDEYLRIHLSAEDYAFHRSNAPENR